MQNGVDSSRTGGSETSSESDSGSRSARVALVGETDDIHDIIRGYLSEEGYEVTARDSELVGGADSERVPDLAVFNPEQSQIDEGDLPRQRVGDATVPVLVVVSPLATRSQGSVTGRGPIEWLVKPFDRGELVEKVEALLGSISRERRDQPHARDGTSGGADAGADAESTPDGPTEAGTPTGPESSPESTPDRTDTDPAPDGMDTAPVPDGTDAEPMSDRANGGADGTADPAHGAAEPGVDADPDPASANPRETAAIRDEIDEVRRRLAELADDGADVDEFGPEGTGFYAVEGYERSLWARNRRRKRSGSRSSSDRTRGFPRG